MEFPFLGFEEFSPFFLLLGFPEEGLRCELHFGSQTSNLLSEFEISRCELDFIILNFGFVFG